MSGPSLSFRVNGRPAPQGSKRYLGRPGGKGIVVESSKKVEPWRADVRAAAEKAVADLFDDLDEAVFAKGVPVAVQIAFGLPRPKSHYGTGRNADKLKDNAPAYPTGKPDLDKLERAVLDALTGVVWADDSQVAHLSTSKIYDPTPGAVVYVTEVGR
jgi:Holliday junction resolvase RusA-like endonuclease